MAEQSARFALELDDQISDPAGDAASALEKVREEIQQGGVAMREMQAAQRRLAQGGLKATQQYKDLADKLALTKARQGALQSAAIKLGETFDKVKPPKPPEPPKDATAGFKELAEQLQRMGGPAAQLGGSLVRLRSLLNPRTLGVLALAAGVVAVTAATAAATVALTRYGIVQANTRRDELLRLEGLGKVRNYMQELVWGPRVAASGKELQANLDAVSNSVALGRDQIAGMQAELYKAGLRGGNLRNALEAMAIVATTQGEAEAAAWKERAIGAQYYGTSIKRLSDDVRARLGGIAAKQLLSLNVQSQRLRTHLGNLFGGLKIEGFLKGLQKVTELFSQNEATGRALKQLIETMFQPLIDFVGGEGAGVQHFIQELVIKAYELRNAWVKVKIAIGEAIGVERIRDWRGQLATAEQTVHKLAAEAKTKAPDRELTGSAVAREWAPVRALGKVLLPELYANAEKSGANISAGIAAGIRAGAPEVARAASESAKAASQAFKDQAEIRSPSQLFKRSARDIPRGTAEGIEQGTPEVERATRRMLGGAIDAAREPSAGVGAEPMRAVTRESTGQHSGGVTIGALHVGPIYLGSDAQSSGAEGVAQDLAPAIRAALQRELEAIAITMGAAA